MAELCKRGLGGAGVRQNHVRALRNHETALPCSETVIDRLSGTLVLSEPVCPKSEEGFWVFRPMRGFETKPLPPNGRRAPRAATRLHPMIRCSTYQTVSTSRAPGNRLRDLIPLARIRHALASRAALRVRSGGAPTGGGPP